MAGSDVGDLPFADLPLPDLLPSVPARRRRSTMRGVVALIGTAALVGVSIVAVTAIGSRGGASSPEAAVRALAHAVDNEDPLAAIDVLAPDEVRTLRNTVSVVERKAAEVKLVNTASKPLAGVDLKVADLALSTEQLAAGYVKVHVTGGVLSAQTHRADFGPALRKLIDRAGSGNSGSCSSAMGEACPAPTTTVDPSGEHSGSVDFAKVRPLDAEPFVVVIRRDGNWYVSPAYTALEYTRIANDLPAPDYGSGLAHASELGASSPQDAATEFVRSLASKQFDRMFGLLAPGEVPFYDYRSGLANLFGKNFDGFTVQSIHATAVENGDTATVELSGSGTYGSGDGTATWKLENNCFSVSDPSSSSNGASLSLSLCGDGVGGLPFFGFAPGESNGGTFHIISVKVDGRWYLSPVATVTTELEQVVQHFDKRFVDLMIGDFSDVPADASLTLGQEVRLSDRALHVYSFQGRAGERVIGTAPQSGRNGISPLSGELFGTDGKIVTDAYGIFYGEPVTLPSTGIYKFVVIPFGAGATTFTLWDAKDAPKSALSPPCSSSPDPSSTSSCNFGLSGSSISSSSASSMVPPLDASGAGPQGVSITGSGSAHP